MSVKSKIQSLLAAANAKTGESDATLTDAVQTLCDGYGQGGGIMIDKYLNNTLERLRTTVNFPIKEMLHPGGSASAATSSALKYVELVNYRGNIAQWGFAYLSGLIRFDAGYTTGFDNVSVTGCTRLSQLIIRADTVPTLYGINAISGNNANLSIYVRPELIADYLEAANWSGIDPAKFKGLYIAETLAEKSSMLADSTIPNGSMIVCDVDESYTVKGAAA